MRLGRNKTALPLLLGLTYRAYWIYNLGPPYVTTEPLVLRRNLSVARRVINEG